MSNTSTARVCVRQATDIDLIMQYTSGVKLPPGDEERIKKLIEDTKREGEQAMRRMSGRERLNDRLLFLRIIVLFVIVGGIVGSLIGWLISWLRS